MPISILGNEIFQKNALYESLLTPCRHSSKRRAVCHMCTNWRSESAEAATYATAAASASTAAASSAPPAAAAASATAAAAAASAATVPLAAAATGEMATAAPALNVKARHALQSHLADRLLLDGRNAVAACIISKTGDSSTAEKNCQNSLQLRRSPSIVATPLHSLLSERLC